MLVYIIIITIVGIAAFVIRNLYKKNVILEDWVFRFYSRAQEIIDEIDRLDHDGTFRADDEVGFFFIRFKEIIEQLYEFELIEDDEKEELLEKLTTSVSKRESRKNSEREMLTEKEMLTDVLEHK